PCRSSSATEEAPWPPQQQGERQGINEKAAEFRAQIFESGIGDAEQQGGEERPLDAAEPTDGDDDEEIDEMLLRVAGIDCQDLGAEGAAQRRQPAAQREGEIEEKAGV